MRKTLPFAVTFTIANDDLRRLAAVLTLRPPNNDPSLPLDNVNTETVRLTEPVTLHSIVTDSSLLVTFGTKVW